MYEISLLPLKYKLEKDQEHKKRDIMIYFAVTVLILAILALLAVSVRTIKADELAVLQRGNADLQNELSQLSVYNDARSSIENVYSEIIGLAASTPSFAGVLTDITGTVPDNIQITSVKLAYDEKNLVSASIITGNAADYNDVSAWITDLGMLESLGEIYCSYTTDSSSSSLDKIRFELKIEVLDAEAATEIVW